MTGYARPRSELAPSSAGRYLGFARLTQLLSAPRAALWVALLAFVMTLPAISLGMVADDYVIAAAVAKDPLRAYDFSERDPSARQQTLLAARAAGTVPWWIDLGYRQSFLRPLSSLSLALDFALWPRATWWMHIENGLLLAAIALIASAIYRGLGLAPVPLGLATFFYALNAGPSLTTGWISGRNTLLATLFGLIALWAHLRALRSDAPVRWTLTAVLAFGCALLSAEAGLAIGGYLVAHACVLRDGPAAKRWLRLWPYALLVVAWQIFYRLGGYGTATGGFYRDPSDDPLGFAVGVLTGVPIYLASQLTAPFAWMSSVATSALAPVTALSCGVLYLLRGLLLPLLRADRIARFLALGAALSVVPFGATVAQDRLAFFVAFGACALAAMAVSQRLRRDNSMLPQAGARRLYRLHVLWHPLLFIPSLFGSMVNAAGGGALSLQRALPEDPALGVILLNGPSHLVGYQSAMREYRGKPPVAFIDMLYAGGSSVRVRRTAARVLELDVESGYLANPIECMGRDPARNPFHAGDVIDLARMQVRVLEVTGGGAPKRVRFEFHHEISSGGAVILAWEGRGPTPWRLPEIGESVVLSGTSVI